MKRRPLLRTALTAALLLASSAFTSASPAFAAPPAVGGGPAPVVVAQKAPAPHKVQLQVRVVHALEGESYVDPQLAQLARLLQSLRYPRFELIDTRQALVAVGADQVFELVGNRTLTLNLLDLTEERARLRITIDHRGGSRLVETTVSINRNGTFIMAGPRHENGILVLPITARY